MEFGIRPGALHSPRAAETQKGDATMRDGLNFRPHGGLSRLVPVVAITLSMSSIMTKSAQADAATNPAAATRAVPSSKLVFDTIAQFQAARVSDETTRVHIRSVNGVTPDTSGATMVGLDYVRRRGAAESDRHSILASGSTWAPVYSTGPVNAGEFGAIPDATFDASTGAIGGSDATTAIQDAINFALNHGVDRVILPCCRYKTTDTLQLGWGEDFKQISLEGESASGAYGGAMAGVSLYPAATDRPAVNFQGVRNGRFANIAIRGQGFRKPMANVAHQDYSAREEDWLDSNLARAGSAPGGLQKHAPYAAITIDAYSGARKTDSYPARKAPRDIGAAADKSYPSSRVTIENFEIYGFPVGISTRPSDDGQGDYVRIRDGTIAYGVYGIAINHSQSRNVEIRNISYGGLHTFLTNSRFGMGGGELAGPIENITGGASYQTFLIAAGGYSGPITVRNLYYEDQVRLGRVGTSSTTAFPATFTCEGCLLQSAPELHGVLPSAVLETDANQTVVIRNSLIRNYSRIIPLTTNTASVVIEASQFATAPTALSGPRNGAPAWQAAINYSGGILIPDADALAPGKSQGSLTFVGRSRGSYLATPTGGDGGQALEADSDVRTRRNLNQANTGLIDARGYRWSFARKPGNALIRFSREAGFVKAPPTMNGDTLAFAYDAQFQTSPTQADFALQPGDFLYVRNSSTLFVVETVGEPTDGAVAVKARQMNNMHIDVKTGMMSKNDNPDPTFAGDTLLIKSSTPVLKQVAFGDFTAGSPLVGNVRRAEAGDASELQPGDRLYGTGSPEPGLNPPFDQVVDIVSVKNGADGSILLSRPATATRRAPIYPIPLK